MDSAKLIAVKEVDLDVETEERAEAVQHGCTHTLPCCTCCTGTVMTVCISCSNLQSCSWRWIFFAACVTGTLSSIGVLTYTWLLCTSSWSL